jgi:hypothetical protein
MVSEDMPEEAIREICMVGGVMCDLFLSISSVMSLAGSSKKINVVRLPMLSPHQWSQPAPRPGVGPTLSTSHTYVTRISHSPTCMQGKPAPLKSSFKLSYYTMLNFLRRREAGDLSMETVIRRSFQQFQQERSLPKVNRCSCGWVWCSTRLRREKQVHRCGPSVGPAQCHQPAGG